MKGNGLKYHIKQFKPGRLGTRKSAALSIFIISVTLNNDMAVRVAIMGLWHPHAQLGHQFKSCLIPNTKIFRWVTREDQRNKKILWLVSQLAPCHFI